MRIRPLYHAYSILLVSACLLAPAARAQQPDPGTAGAGTPRLAPPKIDRMMALDFMMVTICTAVEISNEPVSEGTSVQPGTVMALRNRAYAVGSKLGLTLEQVDVEIDRRRRELHDHLHSADTGTSQRARDQMTQLRAKCPAIGKTDIFEKLKGRF